MCYEAGTIDNTKKLVLEGLSEALHVSVEWLKGETEEYNEMMFLREITHTVNMFNDMGDIVRLYSKNPETATVGKRIHILKLDIPQSLENRGKLRQLVNKPKFSLIIAF